MSTLTHSDNPYMDILTFAEAILSQPEDWKVKVLALMQGTQRNTIGEETWVIWVDKITIFNGRGLRQIVFNRTSCHVSLVGGTLTDFTSISFEIAREVATVLLTYLYLKM